MQLADRHVLVLGLGESGLAMALWCARAGACVRVADTRAAPPGREQLAAAGSGVELLCGAFVPALLDGVDLVLVSPGLPLYEPVVKRALERGLQVTSEIELFARALDQLDWRRDAKIIAITGTNGKTTTTALAGAMLAAAGLQTEVAGNISPAALTALMAALDAGRRPRAWALELSSFQLETAPSLECDAAVVLNVSDDHLDRYSGLDDYAATKARIYDHAAVQVINRNDARAAALARTGRPVLSFGLDAAPGANDFGVIEQGGKLWLARGREPLLALSDLQLAGSHNVANAAAALALTSACGLPFAPLVGALKQFRGLPHRVEFVAAVHGVDYYDDSKGTNVGATLAAVEGMGRPLVVIAGGDGKGQDFAPLGPALAQHARRVLLIGRDAATIGGVLTAHGVAHQTATDLPQAVALAAAAARPGDAVLLSPACASLDMFRNYAHRAQVFIDAVHALARAGEQA
ncbi:MAG: UDP-N-acetylmuramoyl-L-alanine--D-glutamate ligase [Rhodocyclaceae bacterium]|nr:UDP-N-acetylmuramoyl-L-alanine--D-glutamate ligase [Rhodocyclaceae bacterium]MBX3670189.1 UDP-N-acetylmuramoyl-L-alanine--D-glutamate ligase [Rhodocyclaceae bacterium]